MEKQYFKYFIKEVLKNNGATLNQYGVIASLEAGYIVSVRGYNMKLKSIKQLKLKTLNRLLKTANAYGLYIGVWYDAKNKRYEIDANYILNNLYVAVIKARANRQRAIYDIKNTRDILINY